MSDPSKEITELCFAALNDRNWSALRNLICDDTEWTAPGGVVLHGPDQVMTFFAAYFQSFPDARYELNRHAGTETTAGFDATLTGTHLGVLATPGGDIPPTGRSVTLPFAAVFTLRDGRIWRKSIFFDVLGLLLELEVAGQLLGA